MCDCVALLSYFTFTIMSLLSGVNKMHHYSLVMTGPRSILINFKNIMQIKSTLMGVGIPLLLIAIN